MGGIRIWFESLNRQVINYITSPTDRAWQVACRMLLGQMIEKFMDRPLRHEVENLLRELIGKEKWKEPPNVATGRFSRIDQDGIPRIFEDRELAALREAGFENINPELQIISHKKISVDGIKYQSRTARVTKYNNSIAYVNARYGNEEVQFITINSIVTWQHDDERKQGVFGTRFNIIEPAFGTSYMYAAEELQDLVYVSQNNIITPGVLVQSCGQTYISRLPNRWDND